MQGGKKVKILWNSKYSGKKHIELVARELDKKAEFPREIYKEIFIGMNKVLINNIYIILCKPKSKESNKEFSLR